MIVVRVAGSGATRKQTSSSNLIQFFLLGYFHTIRYVFYFGNDKPKSNSFAEHFVIVNLNQPICYSMWWMTNIVQRGAQLLAHKALLYF